MNMLKICFATMALIGVGVGTGGCDDTDLQHDVAKMCNIAEALAIGGGGTYDSSAVQACIADSDKALGDLSDGQRSEAEDCIHCIAIAQSAICSCCQTNGQYDFVGSECAPSCDNDGMRAFCAEP